MQDVVARQGFERLLNFLQSCRVVGDRRRALAAAAARQQCHGECQKCCRSHPPLSPGGARCRAAAAGSSAMRSWTMRNPKRINMRLELSKRSLQGELRSQEQGE